MKTSSEKKEWDCAYGCNRQFSDCIKKGEHQSVCTMKMAQCKCGCLHEE